MFIDWSEREFNLNIGKNLNLINKIIYDGKYRLLLKIFMLAVSIIAIILWQKSIDKKTLSGKYSRSDAKGLTVDKANEFTYFYYYLGIFTLMSTYEGKTYSEEGAVNIIKHHSETLLTDWGFYIRWGEYGKVWVLLFDAFLRHTAKDLSPIPFSMFFFILSLISLLLSFYWIGMPLLGTLLIIFLGSDPYQLFEVYVNDNIFSLNISFMILLLALNLPLLRDTIRSQPARIGYSLCVSSLCGILFATMSNIRGECLSLILSCIFIYIFIPKISKIYKILVISLFFFSYSITKNLWGSYFNYKFEKTFQIKLCINKTDTDVICYKGENTHSFWHPILLGLSDFDNKYGYKWFDPLGYLLAKPILMSKYPGRFTSDRFTPNNKWPVEVTWEYDNAVRDIFIGNVMKDPVWYLEILYKRIDAILNKTVPFGLYVGSTFYSTPLINGWVFIPLAMILGLKRKWFYLKLMFFSLFVSSTALIIHASHNVTYMSVYQIFAGSLIIYFLLKTLITVLLRKYDGSRT